MNNNEINSEKKVFEHFVNTHKKKNIAYKKYSIDYYCSGKGDNTVMVLPHISSIFSQEMAYHHILNFEKNNRVLAPELPVAETYEDVAELLNHGAYADAHRYLVT